MEMETQLLKQDTEYLKREVAELKKATAEGFMAINVKLDIMSDKYVRREELAREIEQVDEAIKKIESNQTWVVRVIIGLVLTAIVGIVITNK